MTKLLSNPLLGRSQCDFAEGHAGVDSRPALRLRIDRKLPIYQLYPLLHASEAKPTGFHRLFDVKTRSRIAHAEVDRARSSAQLHIEAPRSAVFHRILQSFL